MPKKGRAFGPKDVIDTAQAAGLDVRRKGTRIVIKDNRPNSPTRGEMLSVSGHTGEDYDKGQAASIRKWFAKVGITITVVVIVTLYVIWMLH